jgi:DNA-binding winged helix-turn-helix (wHTH) protein
MAAAISNYGAKRIQFGRFEADLRTGELRRSGIRIRLQSQPFKLLAILAEHAGEVVYRETLQMELWGDDTTVNFDHCLGIAVNKLRDALGDSAENPRFIETLAKRGYRFIAPVRILEPEAKSMPAVESPAAESPAQRTSPHGGVWPWLSAGLAVVCLILGALLVQRSSARISSHVAQLDNQQQELWADASAFVFVRADDLRHGCESGHSEHDLIAVNDADYARELSFSLEHTALQGCTIFRHELGTGTARSNGTQLTVEIPAKQAVMFRME